MRKNNIFPLVLSFFISLLFSTCKKQEKEVPVSLYYNIWVWYSADSLVKEKLVLRQGDSSEYQVCTQKINPYIKCGIRYNYACETIVKGKFQVDDEKLMIGNKVILKIKESIIDETLDRYYIETSDGKRFKSYIPDAYRSSSTMDKVSYGEEMIICDDYFEPFTILYTVKDVTNEIVIDSVRVTEQNGEFVMALYQREYVFKAMKFTAASIQSSQYIQLTESDYRPSFLAGGGSMQITKVDKKSRCFSGAFTFSGNTIDWIRYNNGVYYPMYNPPTLPYTINCPAFKYIFY